MQKAILILAVMAIAGAAVAGDPNTAAQSPVKNPSTTIYTPPAEVKVGGDTHLTPTIIPALPYSDTGNTCNFLDDYDES